MPWATARRSYAACSAAVIGPVVEIVIAEAGLFAYHEASGGLFGVAPWLVPLYFAFGVVVALLAEIAARR